jgi:hypothetical protein
MKKVDFDLLLASVNEATLINLLQEAVEIVEFDEHNCDFVPAYGLHRSRREQWLKKVRRLLKKRITRV